MGSPSHRDSRRNERERERDRDRGRDRRDDDRTRERRDEDRSSSRHHEKRRSYDDHRDDRKRHRSRSPRSQDDRKRNDKYDPHKKIKEEPETDNETSRRRRNNNREQEDLSEMAYGKNFKSEEEKDEKPVDKQKPNFGLSGKLSEETNVCNGVVVKYSEPPEARVPKRRWRFYVFKGEETLPTLYIHRQSAYLLGRDRKVADIPVDHPSCSKQHAVLQYRLVNYDRPDGTVGRSVRPYVIDLESANGTFVNNQKIEPKRYVELFEKDVIKFGFSSREYVLLHEDSKTQAAEDDLGE